MPTDDWQKRASHTARTGPPHMAAFLRLVLAASALENHFGTHREDILSLMEDSGICAEPYES